jgi:hypothetical protein
VTFDFDDETISPLNTVEIYIASKKYDDKFIEKWPFFDLLWGAQTIDYLVKGTELSSQYLKKLNTGPSVLFEMYTNFPQFNLILRVYVDENISENSMSFYENFDYVSILMATKLQLIDDLTNEPLSPLAPAFSFDLFRQQKQGYPAKDLERWNKFFKASLGKIDRLGIHKTGFYIPQKWVK